MLQSYGFELLASALQSASGSGGSVDITDGSVARRAAVVTVDVTAFVPVDSDPMPSVLFTLETRANSAAPWRSAGSVSAGALGTYELSAGALDALVRLSWTFTNMTSATFQADASAGVTFCDPSDITRYAVPERSIEDVDASTRAAACIAVTDLAAGYLNSAFTFPITAWGDDLRAKCADLAAAHIFKHRGADPTGPDAMVFDARDKALSWLDRIANGRLKPVGIVDSTPEVFEGGAVVVQGRPKRGW